MTKIVRIQARNHGSPGFVVKEAGFWDVKSIEYLDQAGMIALAESLVYAP